LYYSVVFWRPFIKRFALCYRTVVLSVLFCLSVCNVGVVWPNGWMDQDATEVGLGASNIMLDGDPSPPQKVAQPPIFGPRLLWPNIWMHGWIKMPLRVDVGLGPGHIVLDGDPAPLPKKWHSPQFSAHACCGQTAGWINMPLGTEATLVRLGISFPLQKEGTAPTIFGPCLLWPNGWMDQDVTWYRGRARPRPHCARQGTNFIPPQKRANPQFSAHVCCGQTAG